MTRAEFASGLMAVSLLAMLAVFGGQALVKLADPAPARSARIEHILPPDVLENSERVYWEIVKPKPEPKRKTNALPYDPPLPLPADDLKANKIMLGFQRITNEALPMIDTGIRIDLPPEDAR